MNEKSARVAANWLNKATDALASARVLETAGHVDSAIGRAYYAAFYAASAVLLLKGSHFVKHSGVRAAVHRDLVHTGLIARNFGDIYDVLFESRLTADYVPVLAFTPEQATKLIADAEKFVGEMERLAR